MVRKKYIITQADLHNNIHYDPETGLFTRIHSDKKPKIGTVAGSDKNPYILIWCLGKLYSAHRLAWLYMTGSFPDSDIDHKDGNKQNNKWDNLRLANQIQNSRNQKIRKDNTSGFKGVTLHKPTGKWIAYVYVKGSKITLGYHADIEEANTAAQNGRKKYFGEFNRDC